MSKSGVSGQPRPNGRPRRIGPDQSTPPSPSPVAEDTTQSLSPSSTPGKPSWYLPPDSKVRVIALHIVAMRASGQSDEAIARELQISPKSIAPYVYRAAKNGWLSPDSPQDRIKYELLNKVVDRLHEGLDDNQRHLTTGMKVRTTVAMEMAKGTIFKEYDQVGGGPAQSTVVQVNVVMPDGPKQAIREDTMGGVPNYVEGVVVDVP